MSHFGKEILTTSSDWEPAAPMHDYEGHNILFLDVDGVLNCASTKTEICGCIGIEERTLPILGRIVDLLDADIVLISSWKQNWYKEGKASQDTFANELDAALARYGMHIEDRTYDTGGRGMGIQQWLSMHGPVREYLILDDERHDFTAARVSRHWVRTPFGYSGGLQEKHLEQVRRMWEKGQLRPTTAESEKAKETEERSGEGSPDTARHKPMFSPDEQMR